MTTFVPLLVLLIVLGLGLPVAISLLLAGSLGIMLIGGQELLAGILSSAPGSALKSYELLTIPMFILMAELMSASGIANSLFAAIAAWTSRVRGGLGIATAMTGAAFGAVSGSSTAAAVTLSKTTIPALLNQGYTPRMAGGVVAISGTLAMLIPPSIALIFYGLLSGANIAELLVAGMIPGVLVTLVIALIFRYYISPKTDEATAPRYTLKEKIQSLKVAGPFALLFIVVISLIYTGIATPVESSAIGALGALILTAAYRRLNFMTLKTVLLNTCSTSAMIGLLIVCAHVFSYFLAMTGTTQTIVQSVGTLNISPYFILFGLVLFYLILGLFLDMLSILILTVPVALPIVVGLGFDPVWFGIFVIVLAELGIVTPPVGMNAFVVSRTANIPVEEVFAGVLPYIIGILCLIALMIVFPDIIMWLPNHMRS